MQKAIIKALWLIIIVCTSCKSLVVHKKTLHTGETMPVAIGVIGVQENTIKRSYFKNVTLPVYEQPIRINASLIDFTSKSYKKYYQAVKNKEKIVRFVDTLKKKPQYIKLEIIDNVSILTALEGKENKKTIEYLKSQPDSRMVTTIVMSLPPEDLQKIITAETIFLKNTNYKQYSLSLQGKDEKKQQLSFSRGTIFGYELSSFCWGENNRNRITIFDFVSENERCSKGTYKKAEKAVKKINYLKL